MSQHCGFLRLKLILALSSSIITTSANHVLAQNITIDGTLSPAQTLNGPRYTIPQSVGQTVNSNLFHSFGQFSLNQGESANFQSDGNIRNIFSRVTGGLPSNINGLISTQSPSVNLFLINPSGILFGPNAQLNVGSSTRGSFFATTADALMWSNGSQFSATNPGGTSSLLTIVGDPSGFLFNSRPPQPIQVSGTQLNVSEGQSLLLLGGDVSLENSHLRAEEGRIEIGGVAEPGIVGLTTNGNILSLGFSENVALADVSLTNRSIDVSNASVSAGNINITAESLLVTNAFLSASTFRTGDAGITINAQDVSFDRSFADVRNEGFGSAGINITTGSLLVTDDAVLGADNLGTGDVGITINAQDVSFDDGAAVVINEGFGNADINITTGSLLVTNGAALGANNSWVGNAGITINARDVSFDNSGVAFVLNERFGNAGINITTGSLLVTNGAFLRANNSWAGNAGITINARDVSFDDGVAFVRNEVGSADINITTGSLLVTNGAALGANNSWVGNAGINITTGSLLVTDDAFLSAGVLEGNAGITINAQDVSFDDGVAFVRNEGFGNADINITTGSLLVANGAALGANNSGTGNAGSITINAQDVSFDGGSAFTTLEDGATGNAGNISLTADFLLVTNGGQLFTNSLGLGNAGSINLAANKIALDGIGSDGSPSVVSSVLGSSPTSRRISVSVDEQRRIVVNVIRLQTTVFPNATGNAGKIRITTNSLSVTNGAQLNTSTFGQGNAGDIDITALDIVFKGTSTNGSPSGAFSAVQSEAAGNGGNLRIVTDSLTVIDGAQLVASTSGQGHAGNVEIDADRILLSGNSSSGSPSGVFSAVVSGGVGVGGNININTINSLVVTDGARLSTNTRGVGNAGSITINTLDTVTFDGIGRNGFPSSASSAVESEGVGSGGSLTINARRFNIFNGAEATVSNLGIGNAGVINLTADSIYLNQQGRLTAESVTGGGGDVNLQANQLLLLRGNSLISATSGVTGSEGRDGNININTKFLVTVPSENNDIVATGFGRSPGSNIKINAQGIFGTQFRTQQSLESDIVATGFVTLNTPNVDPTQGLTTLPTDTVNTASLVDSSCSAFDDRTGSTFEFTGRGGLPASPDDSLNGDIVWSDTRLTAVKPQNTSENRAVKPQKTAEIVATIPATGWVFNKQGEVTLINQSSQATFSSTGVNHPSCNAS